MGIDEAKIAAIVQFAHSPIKEPNANCRLVEHTNDQEEQPKTSTLHVILPKTERSSVPNDLPTTLPPSMPSILSDDSTYTDVSEEYTTLPDDLTYEDVNGEYDMEWWKHSSEMSPATNEQPVKLGTLRV